MLAALSLERPELFSVGLMNRYKDLPAEVASPEGVPFLPVEEFSRYK